MARLISAKDIEAAAATGQRTVSFGEGVIVTPAAKDRARELGVTIANGVNGFTAAATAPMPAPAMAAPAMAAPAPLAPVAPPPAAPTFTPPSQPTVQGPVGMGNQRAGGAMPGATITNLRVEVDDRENPVYFDSPVIDNLFNISLELGAAIWVVKDRVRVLEELLEQKGVLTVEQMERYRTPPEREKEVRAKRDSFIEKIYKTIRDNPG
jgi:hypothetical protein